MTWLLLASVLFASVLPCPPTAPAAQGGPPAAARGHTHADEGEAHAASLRAPCHCGCASAPDADASLSRLPLALLPAPPAPSAPALGPLPDDRGAEASEAPAPPIDHVPRHAFA